MKDLPADRMRMHMCWGSTMAPHHTDVPLKDIIDIVLKAQAEGGVVPGRQSAPRARMEDLAGREAAGRQDHHSGRDRFRPRTSSSIPKLVADRIVQYAGVVGRENVIAGVDCGFGTFAGRVQVDTKIVWMKLASLAEGARLASRQLW